MQVLTNILNFNMSVKNAVSSPRIHYEPDLLNVEPGFLEPTVNCLSKHFGDIKQWDELNLFFGGVHAVRSDVRRGGVDGVGDPRRGGVSIVTS